MKKLATLLLAAGMVFGAATGASAIEFKASGMWNMAFDYGQNGLFTGGNGMTGYNKDQDDFEARQRVRLQLDAVASESLSGTVFFEIGGNTWGKGGDSASGGFSLGGDSTSIIKVRRAYLDWMVPETDLKVRMGLQGFALPSFTTGSQVLNEDIAGVVASYKFNENVGLTAFWVRPFNDNFGGYERYGYDWYRSNYMDNMDLGGLVLPLSFDGVKVTPWGMYGQIGPNTFRKGADNYLGNFPASSSYHAKSGLFPAGGARHKDGAPAGKKLKSYADVWFAGLTGEVSVWDPLRIAWDFNYGSVSWQDNGRLNRAGWLASLLFEYKMDWGIPGLYGWYGSGDDDNPSNGSERMPFISTNNTDNDFSTFAFNGGPYWRGGREALMGEGMTGTWGVGARIKDVSFIENLKHTLRVNFMGGTNSPKMAKKLANAYYNGLDADDQPIPLNWGPNAGGFSGVMGMERLYLTTEDTALEVGLSNSYKMYDNFTVYLEGAYIAPFIDHKRSVWGNSKMNGKSDNVRDPWNVNLSFVYSF